MESCKDIRASRTKDYPPLLGGQLIPRGVGDKKILIVRIAIQEFLKPAALGRDMIDHPIKHQLVAIFQVLDILPGSQIGIHGFKVDDSKSSIRGVREEGKDMKGVDSPFEVGIAKFG